MSVDLSSFLRLSFPLFLCLLPLFFFNFHCFLSPVYLFPLHCFFFSLSLSLCSRFSSLEEEVENFDVSSLQEDALRNIEADSFWCMSKLLDGIQVSICVLKRSCNMYQHANTPTVSPLLVVCPCLSSPCAFLLLPYSLLFFAFKLHVKYNFSIYLKVFLAF